jgi:hypothetical protein
MVFFGEMYSLQKLTQFLLGYNVLDSTLSKKDGFVWRDTCDSSNQLNKPIWKKVILSPPCKL